MRYLALLLSISLTGCGAAPSWLDSLVPASLFAGNTALPDFDEEPDGPYLRLTQGRRAGDARLIQQQGARRMWRTRNGVVVATDGVRVVATAGLPMMLAATRFDGPDPLAEPAGLVTRSADARRVLDLMAPDRDPATMRFGVALDCRLVARTVEDQVVITETCRTEGLGIIRNRFWMDRETATIDASEQWVGPGMPLLSLDHNTEAAPETPAPAAPEAEPPDRMALAARGR